MNRVQAFFLREAAECIQVARSELEAPAPDSERLHRAIRRFRGNAQVARYGALAEAAHDLERRLRPRSGAVGGARGPGSEAVVAGGEVAALLQALEEGVEEARAGRLKQDPRTEVNTEAEVADQAGTWGGMDTAGQAGGGDGGGDPSSDVTPLDELEYGGARALDRAFALRSALEDAIVGEEPVGPILDEVFDLIRLGRT